MNEPTLQAVAIQKSLELSEQVALKILVFMAGMKAGRELQSGEKAAKEKLRDRAS